MAGLLPTCDGKNTRGTGRDRWGGSGSAKRRDLPEIGGESWGVEPELLRPGPCHQLSPAPGLRAATGKECSPGLCFLFLHYLHTADGTPPADRWISYRELPDGMFYSQAFQGYSGARLVQTFDNELGRFKEAATEAGAEELSLGDAAFMFQALPRLPLGVVYWLGDEEFAPYANVLFDASASHYLSTDGLAVLGRELCDKIIDQG